MVVLDVLGALAEVGRVLRTTSHVRLFSTLRTDSSQSTHSWTALGLIVVFWVRRIGRSCGVVVSVVIVICITNRSSALVDVLVWTQVVVIVVIRIVASCLMIWSICCMVDNIGLSELVENGPASLGIDG